MSPEMAQHLFQVSPSPTPDPERMPVPWPEARSVNHGSITTVDPPTNFAYYESSPPKVYWTNWLRRRTPKPAVTVLIFLIIITGVSFCPALLSNAKPFDFIVLDGVTADTDGVKILGSVFSFNWADPSKVSVTWSIVGVGNYVMQTAVGYSSDNPPPNTAMDIYLDDASTPAFSYNPNNLPAQWDGEKLPVRSLYSFNMQHYIDVGVQYFAPEDAYSFSTFVFAIDRSTNKSIPIITFEIGSSGSGDFGSTSEVVPSSNQFTYNPGTGPTTVGVKSHTILAGVSRSVPARALTYSMFAINWILAFCSIITTSVSFNRGGGGGDLGITLLPVTVILTIPAVRNLYVGSPPFGIFLDVVGFFPQMLIVASCTVVVLSGYAVKSMRGKDFGSVTKLKM